MSEMSKGKDKTRVSITMTRTYLEALDSLVEEGVYMNRGEIILEGTRLILKEKGIDLPYRKEV